MENVPRGPVGVGPKLDLKNSSASPEVSDGISYPEGKLRNRGTNRKSRGASRIPVFIRRIRSKYHQSCGSSRPIISDVNPPRQLLISNQINRKQSAKQPQPIKRATTIEQRHNETARDKEESRKRLDKACNDAAVKVRGSERVARKVTGHFEATNMSIMVSHNNINNNNNTMDFIEMLTLDAAEFLKAECVCEAKAVAAHRPFCAQCFEKSKSDKCKNNNNDDLIISVVRPKNSCEPTLLRNNDGKQTSDDDDETAHCCDRSDKTSENGCDITNQFFNESFDSDTKKSDEVKNSSCSERLGHQGVKATLVETIIIENSILPGCRQKDEGDEDPVKDLSAILEKSLNGTIIFSKDSNKGDLKNPPIMNQQQLNADQTNPTIKFDDCSNHIIIKQSNREKTVAKSISSTDANLDPKTGMLHQHLVNPPGPFPIINSSGTLPSSSSSSSINISSSLGHRQQSAYGESCAFCGSIGSDGRRREQAPIRSRESTADVVVGDALGRRVSQDPIIPGAVTTDNPSSSDNFNDNCSRSRPNASVLLRQLPEYSADAKGQLTWGFENGRLVFVESKSNEVELVGEQVGDEELVHDSPNKEAPLSEAEASGENELEPPVSRIEQSSTDGTSAINPSLLSSKYINRRADDTNSRLKYLENKLKQAGLTDHTPPNNNNNSRECIIVADPVSCTCEKQSNCSNCNQHLYYKSDKNQSNHDADQEDPESSALKFIQYSEFSNKNSSNEEHNPEGDDDLIPDGPTGFCQFDVNDFSGGFSANHHLEVYDEFLENTSSDESCECDEDEHFIVIRRMRGEGIAMVNDSSDRNKHNPDRDNLKSLLKKPGRGAKDKKSNRVVFNENKNEFFDADYIILIREDCELDDDDEDGICTCQQHEMVRLTCCEPNCNCQYEQTPQSPKFAPPLEFVDAVTLSPPEGYKDMELMAAAAAATREQQRGVVCRECSVAHEEELMEEEGEASQSDSEMEGPTREQEEKEKTDQSQQTTPTTPPSPDNSSSQNYILETLTTTRVAQQLTLREAEEPKRSLPPRQGSPISGILKGGRLWKQQQADMCFARGGDANLVSSDSMTSDEESNNKQRSVRFIESGERKETRDSCDGAPESSPEEEAPPPQTQNSQKSQISNENQLVPNSTLPEGYAASSPDAPEMTLTFKLGNHVLISNNSLKPNSAVRQLFPCTKSLAAAQGMPEEDNSQQYLVTAESLRAFEEAKRSKLPQIIQSGETDETIKRAIERNTLRRSLIRYEPRSKKQPYKSDNSLVERIKQLTCDVEDGTANSVEQNQQQQSSSNESSDPSEDVLDGCRSSPPGEESRNSPDVNAALSTSKTAVDKSFSPSSSSTASSNSSITANQNYHQARKLSGTSEHALMMDLKRGAENVPDIQNNFRREMKPLPDIGGPHNHELPEPPRAIANPPDLNHCLVSNKISSSSNTSESRRQFLSTLAPLTSCVTMGVANNEDYYYHLSNNAPHNHPGDRVSVASSGTEYSLEDIDEGLKTEDEDQKRIAPDVLVGTPSASESGDELAMFVQQDAGRIERIKKKYQPAEQPKDNKNDEDDEHDDYGFNRRPSVRGIKPRFSTTTEILQQIQNQLQPPAPPSTRVAWPYYSESGLTDNSKQKNTNQNHQSSNYQYVSVGEEVQKTRGPYPAQYRPTSLQDEGLYQNCANQRCSSRDLYQRPNANIYSPSVIRMGNDYYQSLPLNRQRNNGRPQSPPPMDMSKQYHQTMVYIPYNHIEGYQPVQYYHHTGTGSDYVARVSSQNQINKRYIEPVYQSRVHHHVDEHHYKPNMIPPVPPKALNRVAYPNNGQAPPHVMGGSRSESPLPGQFSTARSTQTPAPAMATCGYYPSSNPRYRPMVGPVWQGEGNYATKVNRHSFPTVGSRYPPADSISLTDSDSQHSGSLPNGYRQSDISLYASKDSIPNSPTKPRFIERGVPEGAASVSPQDLSVVSQSSSSTMTSPTSPQNPPVPTNQKAMFYAMNV